MTKIPDFDEEEYYRKHPDVQRPEPNLKRALEVIENLKPAHLYEVPVTSKYRNQRTPYEGRVYDTKGEASKARELDYMVESGEIDFWLYHVRFRLPGNCVYECDFMTFKHGFCSLESFNAGKCVWDIEVIEKKMWRKASKNRKEGFWFTEASKIKFKLFKETYPNIKLVIEK